MSQIEERVRHLFGNSIETKILAADAISQVIAQAGQKLVNCLLNDGKILLCGNAGSAANCFHFSAAMLNHFEVERPALPVINLSADISTCLAFARENQFEQVYAQQILALAKEKDILLLLTTSGNANSMINALHAANEREIDTIALNGGDGGILASHLGPEDLEIRVNSDNVARIREIHLFILHCFCDLIDQCLFGQLGGV